MTSSQDKSLDEPEAGGWIPFTPTWTGPKFHWWQFIKKYRQRRLPKFVPYGKYKLTGKTVHYKIGYKEEKSDV
jgi:hypothetical protein